MSAEWELVVNIMHAWFTSPLVQTLVGAGAGALIAFHRQNIKEKKIELERNIGLINYSLISLAANIEKAIELKKYFLPRSQDATAIKSIPGMQDFLESGQWRIDTSIYHNLPEHLKKYLIRTETDGVVIIELDLSKTDLANVIGDFYFLELPDLKEMAGLAKRHPQFLILAHRCNEKFQDAIYTNQKINETTSSFSKERRRIDELKFSFMLSLAKEMEKNLDAGLFYMDKCKEMLYKICDETLPEKRSGIRKITIKKEFLIYMPKKDHIPGYENI